MFITLDLMHHENLLFYECVATFKVMRCDAIEMWTVGHLIRVHWLEDFNPTHKVSDDPEWKKKLNVLPIPQHVKYS